MKLTRKSFLSGIAKGLAAAGLPQIHGMPALAAPVPGKLVGANSSRGHKLRDGSFPSPQDLIETDVVIVGGGISGLSAAHRFAAAGFKKFILLEHEDRTGGNSLSGSNSVTAYPWGAHYVPLLTEDSRAVRKLFEELGVITGYDERGLPNYNEYYLCGDPQERLHIYGRWQDGLVPSLGASFEDKIQYKRFFAQMEDFKKQKGLDGKTLFAIPIDESSADAHIRALDQITMAEWMGQQGYNSEPLNWYVNYACRDDFGTRYDETSAWAGIHYFASRNGRAANAQSSDVITWPEGNGWLAKKLSANISQQITTDALTFNVTKAADHVLVDYWHEQTNQTHRVKAKAVIMATPQFITNRILKSEHGTEGLSYAPWAVANITLSRLPGDDGVALSWDNVVYKSKLLGYVVATHQLTQMNPIKTVLTYYWPLSHTAPADARKQAMARSLEEWQNIFLDELLKVHPELKEHIEQIDVCIWGHAMVRPIKKYIWGVDRAQLLQSAAPIFRAHCDMSGISIFEEAYTHGVRAAEAVLSHLNVSYPSVL
jgi:NAD(P)-binding Rossmann-like domain